MSGPASGLEIEVEAVARGWNVDLVSDPRDGGYNASSRFRRVVMRGGTGADNVIHVHPSGAVDGTTALATGGGTSTESWLLGYNADTIGTTDPNQVDVGDRVQWHCLSGNTDWSFVWNQRVGGNIRSNILALPARAAGVTPDVVEGGVLERKRGMSFLGSLETDALWTPMDVNHGTFATGETTIAAAPRPRYPATVHHTIGHFSCRSAVQVSSQRAKALGMLMVGAGERAPDRTPYRVRGHFFSPALRLQAFYAMAPASPSAAAAGEVVSETLVFDAEVGGVLDIDDVIMIAPPATANLGRALVFGIQAINSTGSAVTGFVAGTFSCQRLIGPPPSFVDRRK